MINFPRPRATPPRLAPPPPPLGTAPAPPPPPLGTAPAPPPPPLGTGAAPRGRNGWARGAAPGGAAPLRSRPTSASAPGGRPRPLAPTLTAWAELLRVSALFTVPGDPLTGAAALSIRPNRGTALAAAASLCLYEAGMALNDWADRAEDATDRPHRPIPSGRISPAAALTASCVLTAAGLTLAARAGRPTLAVAAALTTTIWSYDLKLKHTSAAPAAMAAARTLDVLMGAVATATTAHTPVRGQAPQPRHAAPRVLSTGFGTALRAALPTAVLLGAHTYAVTEVSRHEAQGGSSAAPLAALAATAAVATTVAPALRPAPRPALRPLLRPLPRPLPRPGARNSAPSDRPATSLPSLVATALAATYLRTTAKPLLHAALNPSPPLTQRAVGGGIRAMIPLQAALAARSGAPGTGAALMLLAPLARRLARKVSPT